MEHDHIDEAENQAMLAHFGAVEVTVVRNAEDGKILSAVATYADGETEILYHMVSPRMLYQDRAGRRPQVRGSTSRRES